MARGVGVAVETEHAEREEEVDTAYSLESTHPSGRAGMGNLGRRSRTTGRTVGARHTSRASRAGRTSGSRRAGRAGRGRWFGRSGWRQPDGSLV